MIKATAFSIIGYLAAFSYMAAVIHCLLNRIPTLVVAKPLISAIFPATRVPMHLINTKIIAQPNQ